MLVKKFESRDDWMAFRRGKITGTRLKDLIVKRGTGKKKGFWELIAERVAIAPDDENPMERGQRLEKEAIQRFTIETGKDVNTDLVMWMREEDERMALSPDGYIGETEALEIKCLNSASHLEAYLTQEIPTEYISQTEQYFAINDKLEKLYVCFYDPRIPCKDFFIIEVLRDQAKVIENLELERMTLKEIDDIVAKLTA